MVKREITFNSRKFLSQPITIVYHTQVIENCSFFQAPDGASACTNRLVKPSFVQPSQTLEKSLKEHIQRTAGLTDWENEASGAASKTAASSGSKKGHKKDKRKAPSSKEASPSELRISSSNTFSKTFSNIPIFA